MFNPETVRLMMSKATNILANNSINMNVARLIMSFLWYNFALRQNIQNSPQRIAYFLISYIEEIKAFPLSLH